MPLLATPPILTRSSSLGLQSILPRAIASCPSISALGNLSFITFSSGSRFPIISFQVVKIWPSIHYYSTKFVWCLRTNHSPEQSPNLFGIAQDPCRSIHSYTLPRRQLEEW